MDGWGDDDDFEIESDEGETVMFADNTSSTETKSDLLKQKDRTGGMIGNNEGNSGESSNAADGWGDDDLDLDIAVEHYAEIDDAKDEESQGRNMSATASATEGWNDESLDLDIPENDLSGSVAAVNDNSNDNDNNNSNINTHVDCNKISEPLQGKNLSENEKRMHGSLVDYMQSLPHIVSSLNAVLEAEYNTYDHALHLCEYYENRPQLRDYTLETELPRMQYRVILSDDNVLTEKRDVADYIQRQPNLLLLRSANQSLLADILTAITGPDLLIRPQHLATTVATTCTFTLCESYVQCDCRLNLSVPGISGDRVDIAFLDVSAILQPNVPSVFYNLREVVFLPGANEGSLKNTAIFLSSIAMDEDLFAEPLVQSSNADAFRDSFLLQISKTQQMVQASQTGLSSAWKQIDSVANVSSKFDFVKKVGEGIMPSLTAPDPVSQLSKRDHHTGAGPTPHSQLRDSDYGKTFAVDAQPALEKQRPVPILGGFLMSGLNRLTKTVTAPDENVVAESRFPRPIHNADQTKGTLHHPARQVQSKPTKIITPHQTRAESMPAQVECMQSIVSDKAPYLKCPPTRVQDSYKVDDTAGVRDSDNSNDEEGWEKDDIKFDDELPVDTQPDEYESTAQKVFLSPPQPSHRSDEERHYETGKEEVQHDTQVPGLAPTFSTAQRQESTTPLHSPAVDYNFEDDIIPTRIRWRNCRMTTTSSN